MDGIYLIFDKHTGEIIKKVNSLREAFTEATGDLKIWEVSYG